jgi:hypothetical protein
MTPKEFTEIQLEAHFGTQLPRMIQKLVNRELDAGIWKEGYDLAVSDKEIAGADATELLQIVLKGNESNRIDLYQLQEVVGKELPQSSGAKVLWIADDSGDFALTDSLRVARFSGARLIWKTPRLSYDGIEFDSILGGKLNGRAWLLGSHESPYAPFVLDFDTGKVLSGHIVDH